MFTYKTEAELTAMSEAERNQYAIDKRAFEAGENKAAIKAAFAEFELKKANEELEALKTEKTSTYKALEDQLKELQEKLAQFEEGNAAASKSAANFNTLLEKALTDALPTLKKFKEHAESEKAELVMEIKAAVDVTTTAIGNAAGSTTPVSYVYGMVTDYASDIRANAYIINFMDNGTTDKPSFPYMDKLPTQGAMAITPEGTLKPLISVSFEIRYSVAEKIAGRVKVTEEALDDIPGLMALIQNELRYEHDIAEQAYIFAKINAIAGAFVAGGMAASTDDPSNFDAIRAVIYAIKIASKGRYIPNAALVPSSDVYNMGATKDTTGQYVMPTFVTPDGTKVAGVQIVEVNDDTVAVGSFVVGDFRKLKRRVYKAFTIRMNYGIELVGGVVVSDFETNKMTILGESRLHLYVYENEKVAFVKTTFAAVKTAIAKPVV